MRVYFKPFYDERGQSYIVWSCLGFITDMLRTGSSVWSDHVSYRRHHIVLQS